MLTNKAAPLTTTSDPYYSYYSLLLLSQIKQDMFYKMSASAQMHRSLAQTNSDFGPSLINLVLLLCISSDYALV